MIENPQKNRSSSSDIRSAPSIPIRSHLDDDRSRDRCFWDEARGELTGLPDGGGLNIGYEAVDRHGKGAAGDRTAFLWVGEEGEAVQSLTYRELMDRTGRFANLLGELGVERGAVVCALSERIPEFYIAALGTLKFGGIFCALFSAFGPDPLHQRLRRSRATVLLASRRQYREKIAGLRDRLPDLKHILLFDGDADSEDGATSLNGRLAALSSEFSIPPTDPRERALLHFTSGTTGMPKGAVHVHEAVVVHSITAKYVLDLHPEDVFWCTADPGWVTGVSYGIIAPLVRGVTSIVDSRDFDPLRWMKVLENRKVNVWYTSPSAIRRLMRLGDDLFRTYDLSRLRHVLSVGEPLPPDAVDWGRRTLGAPVHDTWWQTETGGILIANHPGMALRPGSMGRPLPGIEAAVIRISENRVETTSPGETGLLAIRAGWPSMFQEYLNEPDRYRKCFVEDWYITGDLARRDGEGYFWFVGRSDDIIKTAGHMVGPFEVESVLMEHPSVADAAVVGIPDPLLGERVKAFIVARPGIVPGRDLERAVMAFARRRLGPAVAPREISFRDRLPKNRAGKVMRRLLKTPEPGSPEEDISLLEPEDRFPLR